MRVALLLDDERIQSYFAAALTEMVEKTSAEIELVVVNDELDDGLLKYVRKGLDRPDCARIVGSQVVWERLAGTPGFREPVPYERVPGTGDAPRVRCEPAPQDGFSNELPDAIVERIVDETDVFIRSGFGVLKGDILFEPEHGVLSYHHGDPREYRSGPLGFWEFLQVARRLVASSSDSHRNSMTGTSSFSRR